jgi:SH3-like domain-containing protein
MKDLDPGSVSSFRRARGPRNASGIANGGVVSLGTAALVGLALSSGVAAAADGPNKELSTGLPLPRFVSLKADKVHVRQGPGTDHKIAWVFQQAGLPVEVIQEFETWRRVRDSEGATGWVFHAMLSGRRTVLVLPWETKDGKTAQADLRASGSPSSAIVAVVEAGVQASVRTCDGVWCEINVGTVSGHIEQKKLWGVYEKEPVK